MESLCWQKCPNLNHGLSLTKILITETQDKEAKCFNIQFKSFFFQKKKRPFFFPKIIKLHKRRRNLNSMIYITSDLSGGLKPKLFDYYNVFILLFLIVNWSSNLVYRPFFCWKSCL